MEHGFSMLIHQREAIASAIDECAALRYAAALSFSCYACCETSGTRSHRDFPAVYVLWALALYGDSPTAAGLALGVGQRPAAVTISERC